MRLFTVVALSSLLLVACGQTGPLYMPTEEPKPAAAPADAETAPDATAAPEAAPQGTATEAPATSEAK